MTERSSNGTFWLILFAAFLGALVWLHTPGGRVVIQRVHGGPRQEAQAARDSSQ